ncbi:ImmA/IrrE family metallo-endopeptidase [Aneurinibacillus sp. Ricciae_BoGa-3]|uniref:ImmA/IrrE family metallo-endopeptidase n=1 Tax=Aneurinibacillus sp. Ricciae_BoGa-3 TaxID=3022697 RepID=UPI0023401E9A|nr:ImmA/IrrE family metallo-endopeptidase [Aneurinibacillus sp. Ricciae_BoGa-3]WCK53534.1 ImmA/IrrE family metallo-endopeptidase [Aneurinibacillus sp. Ricciae_BoGa-3]
MFERPEGKVELSDPVKSSIRLETMAFANETRERLGISPIEPIEVIQHIERDGVFVFQIKNLGSSGFVRVFGDQKAIFVNADHSLGRQYYTNAHEYCHVVRDLNKIQILKELPEEERKQRLDQIEEFAFKFADYFLMPEPAIYKSLETLGIYDYKIISVTDVIRIQHHFNVSYRQTVRMLNKANVISDEQRHELGKLRSKENPDELLSLTTQAGFNIATLALGLEYSRIPSILVEEIIANIRNSRMTYKKVKHLEDLLGISLKEYWPVEENTTSP